jgi:hypothetical protein
MLLDTIFARIVKKFKRASPRDFTPLLSHLSIAYPLAVTERNGDGKPDQWAHFAAGQR